MSRAGLVGQDVDQDQDWGNFELQEDEGCYVYGVVPSDAKGPGVSGLDDAPVGLLRLGPVAAVVSAVRLERPAGRRHDLLAHSRVLDAYAANGPVVPVRFGSILMDAEAVRSELLEPRKERFVELLAELTGAVQFNLQARYDEAAVLTEVVGSNPEIARLRERTRDRSEEESYADRVRLGELVSNELAARREGDAHTVLSRLQPHVLAHRERAGGSLDHLTDLALLVDITRRDAFETAAEKLAADMHERARLRLLGPMAPYDFVGED